MTLIGKLLAFLNLVAGLGLLTWSVTVYTLRPGWFDPIPEGGVSPGSMPENFKMIAAEVDSLSRAATASTASAATQRTIFDNLEKKRADRLKKYEERINWAKNGNPKDQAGFYEPLYEKDSGLLDLDNHGDAIKGSDELPLKGSEKLLTNLVADTKMVDQLQAGINEDRAKFSALRDQILGVELRLLRMTEIRESVQAELFYLSSFEANAYETRETVFRRKKQLDNRLKELK